MIRWLLLVLACALLISVPLSSTDPFLGFRVTDPPFTSLTYGIQTFVWWDHGFAGRDLDWVRQMVFSHVKQTFAWEDLQPVPGEFDFTQSDRILGEVERRGLKLIARLSDTPDWAHPSLPDHDVSAYLDAPPDDLADFAAYCTAIAERYRGRIDGYQIWNEPNLSREWGNRPPDAAGYVQLLAACSNAIRAADPEAILISGGLSPTGTHNEQAHPDDLFLQEMYDAGFQQYVDVVGMHAPGFSVPELSPDEAQASGGQRFFTFRRIEDLRKIMVANGDAARQVAILETGWTTDQIDPNYSWFAVSEAEQAQNLVAAFEYAAFHWRPWVGLMSVIYIADPDWNESDEEWWWAITTPAGYTRLAYIELANMAKYCGDRLIPARAPNSPEALGLVPVTPCS
ncbi:MAG: cellulase family glycosylhydrolase [Anaerolineae bacterium]|nr:cellulase family glycosylhydrolase [Anaerolineae bacterium]